MCKIEQYQGDTNTCSYQHLKKCMYCIYAENAASGVANITKLFVNLNKEEDSVETAQN